MDTIIFLVLFVCGSVLAASQQKPYYDEQSLAEIKQIVREELKAEIQEVWNQNKAEIQEVRGVARGLMARPPCLRLATPLEVWDQNKAEIQELRDQNKAFKDEALSQIPIKSPKAAAALVAFSASRTTDLGPVTVDTTIMYDDLEVSYGGGFDPATGIFTVPVTGLYLLHMGTQGDDAVVNFYINQDNYRHARTGPAPSFYSTGTVMAIVELTEGYMVRAELEAGFGSGHIRCGLSGPCYMGGYLLI